MARERRGQLAVVVVAEDLGQVLVQRSAVGDVEQLHAAADAEQRDVLLARGARERQLEVVAAGLLGGGGPMRLLPVAPRRDVAAAAAQDHAVDRVEQLARIGGVVLVGDEQDRAGAGALDGADVGDGGEGGVLIPVAGADVAYGAGDGDGGAPGHGRAEDRTGSDGALSHRAVVAPALHQRASSRASGSVGDGVRPGRRGLGDLCMWCMYKSSRPR